MERMLQISLAPQADSRPPAHWKPGAHPWIYEIGRGLYAQWYPRTVDGDELRAFVQEVEQLVLSHRTPYAWVMFVDGLLGVNAAQRKVIADHVARMRSHDRRYCAGGGIVASTPFARGLVTAVFWLSPLVYPHEVFRYIDRAEAYARDRLRERLLRT